MKWYLSIAIILVVTVGTLIFTEIGLRLADYPNSPPIGWQWRNSPYKSEATQHDQRTNQLGLRGHEIKYADQDYVIVLLGDSQVEAGAQSAGSMPEALLEAALQQQNGAKNVRVFSVASAGWGQDQQLIWLRRYLEKYRADLIICWFSPSNDYWENTFADRSVTREVGRLKPTFTLAGGNQVLQGFPALNSLKLTELFRLAAGRLRRGQSYSLEHLYAELWDRNLPPATPVESPAAACPSTEATWQNLREAYFAGTRAFTAVTDDRLEQGRSRFSPFLTQRTLRDDYMVALTHALLGQIAAAGEAKGAEVRLFYPYRTDLDDIFHEVKCVKTKATGKYFQYDGSDFLRHLKKTPLADRLMCVGLTGSNFAIANDDWHLNADGNQLAMRLLAKEIVNDNALWGKVTAKRR